jgi:serine/threonine protein kinase
MVERVLSHNLHIASELAAAEDHAGRPALNIASPACQRHIRESLYFYKRYEIPSLENAQHRSVTCVLYIAIDHGDNKQKVALKFMSSKEQFEREKDARHEGGFEDRYVVAILRSHESDTDPVWRSEVKRRNLEGYPDCIVMVAADRDLTTIIASENIAGKDWNQIRHVTLQVVEAIKHMHDRKYVHGDIKPLNVMRFHGRIKLIDFEWLR